MSRTKSTKASPPPSPSALLKAQVMVTKAAQKKAKAKKAAKSDAEKENKGRKAKSAKGKAAAAPAEGKAKRTISISWAKLENHHFTSTLLTAIEANNTWIVAFGFNKGAAGAVSSRGKKTVDHYRELTMLCFIGADCPGDFLEDDIPKLVSAVRNRVGALKTLYIQQRDTMSETGQGIVHNNQEDTLIPNSECANAWDLVQAIFPWYKRMHALMGTSPVVSKAALAHSASDVDLSVLSRDGGGDNEGSDKGRSDNGDEPPSRARHESLPWDIERPSSPDDSHRGSPGYDDLSNKGDDTSPSPPAKTPSKAAAGPPSLKRKSLHDQLQSVADSQSQARYKIAKMQAEGKASRADRKANTKRQGVLEVELLRLQFQREESLRHHNNLAAQRSHELEMLDRQIELERARAGGPMNNTDPTLR
ncbi:hypothetical protein JOM56_007876 [Amanita muscaria]